MGAAMIRRDCQSDLSMHAVREDRTSLPADSATIPKLQQAVNLANQNCDRATALAHKLVDQLRWALTKIQQLENGVGDRLQAEVQTAVAKLQAEADARVGRTKREAYEHIAGVKLETENKIARLQGELTTAKQRAEEARAEADARIELINSEARERIARAEAEANEQFGRLQHEVENQLRRLDDERAQAKVYADRAERWLMLVRQEVEEHLMPSLETMHERIMAASNELGE